MYIQDELIIIYPVSNKIDKISKFFYVDKENGNLHFKNLTMAPIEKDLINFDLLTVNEKNYLFKYHLEVYSKISKYLNPNEKSWLATFI